MWYTSLQWKLHNKIFVLSIVNNFNKNIRITIVISNKKTISLLLISLFRNTIVYVSKKEKKKKYYTSKKC